MMKFFLGLENHKLNNLRLRTENLLTITLKIRSLENKLKESKPDHHSKILCVVYEIKSKMIDKTMLVDD